MYKLIILILVLGLVGCQSPTSNQSSIKNDYVEVEEEEIIFDERDFELLAPVPFATLCFRYHPKGINEENVLNKLNNTLMEKLNNSGRIYLTHTKLNGKFSLRFVIGQTEQTWEHVIKAWELIKKTAVELK